MSANKIRIGGVPEHFNLPWHVGIEQGHFERVDVEAEFRVFGGGTGAMMQAVDAGEIDVAIVLSEGCLAAIANGVAAKVVKTFVASPLIWGIHTAAASAITAPEQMQGKRYAVSRLGSGSHLMAIVDADIRQWSTDDLQFIKIGNLDGARAALAAGDADIFFWERFTTSPFVENGEFQRIGERLTPWPAFVVCVSDRAIKDNGPVIARMLNQVNKICRQLESDPSATISTISQRYDLRPEQTAQWLETLAWSRDWQMDSAAFVAAVEYLQKLDLIEGDAKSRSADEIWKSVYLSLDD